jgi:hypothetical protein
MSERGKTLLKGHTLSYEGAPRFDDSGHWNDAYRNGGGRAKCSCGALSPKGQGVYANRKWHRAHKDSLR